jgi:hypothetical protein
MQDQTKYPLNSRRLTLPDRTGDRGRKDIGGERLPDSGPRLVGKESRVEDSQSQAPAETRDIALSRFRMLEPHLEQHRPSRQMREFLNHIAP